MKRILFIAMLFVTSKTDAATKDLVKATNEIRAFMQSETALTAQNCAVELSAIVKHIESFESKNLSRNELKTSANQIVSNLWQARQLLRKKMIRFHQAGNLSLACVSGIRNVFSSLRFVEEYAGVHTLPNASWLKAKPQTVFSGGFPAMVGAAGLSDLNLQSGDILVSYGMAYGSAAISHVGDDGGTFSHMAVVYVTPEGQVLTIEAHPEFGVKVAPIEKYLHDGKGRSALFRHPDRQLASVAGKAIYDIAFPPDNAGRPIPYDFAMNLKNQAALFCTETASYAYEIAREKLGRSVIMPMFPTSITMKDPYIIDAFEIKERVTFAPSDIEVDPQFEMIAEWRDLGRARLMHHQQAALKMEFKWLDTLDYAYRTDLGTGAITGILYSSRRLPLFSGLVDDMVPPDLSKKALQAVVNVYLTSDRILDKMLERDRLLEKKKNATLMTAREILKNLESLRRSDLESYRAYQMERLYPTGGENFSNMPSDQFHWLLRPRNEY